MKLKDGAETFVKIALLKSLDEISYLAVLTPLSKQNISSLEIGDTLCFCMSMRKTFESKGYRGTRQILSRFIVKNSS